MRGLLDGGQSGLEPLHDELVLGAAELVLLQRVNLDLLLDGHSLLLHQPPKEE